MFEKLVDALHLHANPKDVDDFWEYYFVQLEKLGFIDMAEKLDPNWRMIVEKFKKRTKGGTRAQSRWATQNLVNMAKNVGLGEHLKEVYYLPNLFIHNSSAELMFSLQTEPNGSLTPIDYNTPEEINMADVAFLYAFFFLLRVLALEVEHYKWVENEAPIQECIDEFVERAKAQKVGNFSL